MTSPLFIEMLPHIILSPKVPATGKMIELLMLAHIFKSFEMCSANIEINIPVVSLFKFLNTIELEGVDNAFIFRASYFIVKLCFFKTVNAFMLYWFFSAAFWVLEEDGGWPIFEYTFHKMNFVAFPVWLLTIKINTFVERFIVHPD